MTEIKNLRFSYGLDFTLAIDTLAFPETGFVSLIGPNGSGKTTLLRIMTGLLRGYTGDVVYGGRPLNAMTREETAGHVAYVPVYARPDGPVSVESFILSGAYRYGGEADITGAAKLCGADKLLGKTFTELSSGEMKRVLIARALVQGTDVIVMDEPFANLDPYYEMLVMELVREISKKCLIISAVHNVTVASIISCMTAGLKNGGLVFTSEQAPNVAKLKDLYGAEFISVQGHPFPDYFQNQLA